MDLVASELIILQLLVMTLSEVQPEYRTDYLQDSCGCSVLDTLLCNPFRLLPQPWGAGHVALSQKGSFSRPFYCQFVIEAPVDHRVQLSVNAMVLSKSESCQDAMLQVFDGIPGIGDAWPIVSMCGDKPKETLFRSRKNILTIFYSQESQPPNTEQKLNLTYTYFYLSKSESSKTCPPVDNKDSFRCKNGLCVSSDVRCDGYDNCQDGSDESMDYQMCGNLTKSDPFVGLVVGCVMGGLVFIALVTSIAYVIRRKKSPYTQARRTPPEEEPLGDAVRPAPLPVEVQETGNEAVLTPDIMRDLPNLASAEDTAVVIVTTGPDGSINSIQTGRPPGMLPPSYSTLFPEIENS